jgi:putative transposase
MFRASRRGPSTTWSRPWACRGSARARFHRLCEEIDGKVKAFLEPAARRRLALPLDRRHLLKVRRGGRIVSVAVIIAVGVNTDGRREVLGMEIGTSEAEPIWTEFLRKLTRRGLRGVKLVISDAHEGIKAAVSKVLSATWQRCRVHFSATPSPMPGRAGGGSSPPSSPPPSPRTRPRPPAPSGARRRPDPAQGAEARHHHGRGRA